ncbi:hypothetical protein JAB8_44550 [Janthinobacterium sp. HH106]|uniref:hypothetical protein n=1 Tax=Janthinobacterium sp. HH106 TaxID=1537278 RepID=UPI000893A7F8|nr:hypothetical protein [Janthinobacterium sp. HH106]OEZ82872.1 hypothetical protein JAB8_44550 [Janthinobacterium sp. HH106]
MKIACKLVTAVWLCAAVQAGGQALETTPGAGAGAGAGAAPPLTQSMIRDAVRAVLAEEAQARDALPQPAMQQVTIRADRKYEQFSAAFAEAKVPDCLHADGLKRQPTSIGPIGIGGVYALPFVAIAKLRGKCN